MERLGGDLPRQRENHRFVSLLVVVALSPLFLSCVAMALLLSFSCVVVAAPLLALFVAAAFSTLSFSLSLTL